MDGSKGFLTNRIQDAIERRAMERARSTCTSKEKRCEELREALRKETLLLPRSLQPRASRGPEYLSVLRDIAQAGSLPVEAIEGFEQLSRRLQVKFRALSQLEPTRDAKEVLDKAEVLSEGTVEHGFHQSCLLEQEDLLIDKEEGEDLNQPELRKCNACGRVVLATHVLKHGERCRSGTGEGTSGSKEERVQTKVYTGGRHWLVPPMRRKRSKDRTRPANAWKLTRKMMILRTTITYRNNLKLGCKSFGCREGDG